MLTYGQCKYKNMTHEVRRKNLYNMAESSALIIWNYICICRSVREIVCCSWRIVDVK